MDKVHNIVQEAVTKTIPKKKKCKKAKCFSEEALQIAEERKEVKSKGEEKEVGKKEESKCSPTGDWVHLIVVVVVVQSLTRV